MKNAFLSFTTPFTHFLSQKSSSIDKNPTELIIPKLGIKAKIESVGIDIEGKMDVPKDENNVGWYMPGPVPGEKGKAVIAGHFDSKIGPAVFYRLSELNYEDEVIIKNKQNEEFTFVVKQKDVYPDESFPIATVFGNDTIKKLNLITCEGVFDRTTQNYSNRTVVYTELKEKPSVLKSIIEQWTRKK